MPPRQQAKDDLSLPISVTPPINKALFLQQADDSYNAYILRERESHGKRTVIKISFEVYARKGAKPPNFVRFRNMGMLVSCPDGRQAQRVMDVVERVISRMDGKLMATD